MLPRRFLASRRRFLASAVGLALVTFALAGCSLLPLPGQAASSGSASKPSVGQCWNASFADAAQWADWQGASATSCTGSHVLYTYQVGTIHGVTSSTWAAPGDPTNLSDAVQSKAAAACTISTLLPHQKWNQQLIQDYFFVPSEAQWKAGARWVRCDVGVLATGTTIANERLSPLPTRISTFVSAVSSNPARYEFCINSPQSVTAEGPLDDPESVIADCTRSPQWKLASRGNLPEASGAPFPSDAVANAESTAICSPAASGAGQIWVAYLPTAAGWASGDREVDCWVGQKTIVGGQTA
jgi:hypothetical protein